MQDNSEDRSISNSVSSENVELTPGSLIDGKYQIVSLLGRGGMGAVYRVQQVTLGKYFALKVLDLHQRSDVAVRRFQQEARTASQLQHANLVEVHDFGVFNHDQPYLVMDLVEGQTLSQILKSKGALPVDYVVNLCIQICLGLKYAHEKGVVHRDIKPGNIMLLHPDQDVTEGTVKVVDFGIAKLVESEKGENQTLTKTGEIFGSPVYMSPEQCKGDAIDRRSDIYSLGCVMFECLTGSPPFFGDSAMSTMLKRLSEAPVSLKEGSLGREFPPALERIVRKMLEVDPNDRYQDMKSVAVDLMATHAPVKSVFSGRPTEGLAVKTSQQVHPVFLFGGIAAISIVSTFAYDSLIALPEKMKEQQRIEAEKRKISEIRKAEVKRRSLYSLKSLASYVVGADKRFPYFEKSPETSKLKEEFIVFPKNTGSVIFDGETEAYDAVGTLRLKPKKRISILLNQSAGQNPSTLKNLTNMHFHKIDYCSNMEVTDETIWILNQIEHLSAVGLTGCDVKSLVSLYKNKNLRHLELRDSSVDPSEVLKLESLGELQYLTIGCCSDATALFDELAKTQKISNLLFKGHSPTGGDVDGIAIDSELESLSKLKSLKILSIESNPHFHAVCLKKMSTLPNLEKIVIRDCSITAKAIPIFRNFPKLKSIELTTDGWSEADKLALQKLPMKIDYLTASSQRARTNQSLIHETGLIDGPADLSQDRKK